MNSKLAARFIAPLFVAVLAIVLAQERALAISPLNGSWKGVYYTYPDVITVELVFQPAADGAASGELKFYPATQQRNALGAIKGSYKFMAQFDEATQTFTLKPGAWIERPQMGGAQVPIIGVFDSAANRLAGVFQLPSAPNPQFFVAAPGAAGEQLVAAITKSAYTSPEDERRLQQRTQQDRTQKVFDQLPPEMREKAMAQQRQREEQRRAALEQAIQQAAKSPNGQKMAEILRQQLQALEPPAAAGAASSPSAPSPEAIAEWAGRLKTEVSKIDLRSTTIDRLFLSARNLFEDETFTRCFGVKYDEMEVAQRRAVHDVFAKNGTPLNEYAFLARPFQKVGDFGAPDLTVSVWWQRSTRAWLNNVSAIFAKMPATRDSFAQMKHAEAIAGAVLVFLWPGEKSRFGTVLAETRTRLAVPVLNEAAAQLIASARDVSGARELATWDTREKELLGYAPTADRDLLHQRIDARLDELLDQLLATELRAIPGFGAGIAAVEAGSRWYQKISHAYDFALNRAPVQRALQQFKQARAGHLAGASLSLISKIDAAQNEAEVNSLLTTYLGCPGDDVTEIGRHLRNVADKRLAYLREQEQRAMFSENEQKIMDHPGHLVLTKLPARGPWAPSSEEVRLALLRGFAFGSGKMLDPHKARLTSRANGLLVPVTMIVRVGDLQIKRFAPDGDSFWVEYTAEMSFALPEHDPLWDADPNLRRGGQMAVDMANATTKLLSDNPVIEQVRLYADGWGVPRLRELGAANAGLDALVNSMRTQRHSL